MDKMDMKSQNLVNVNIEKIAELFPNCVTETEKGKAIDFDMLKQELSENIVDGQKEKYQLTWPGKKEAIVTANTPTTNTLRPVREKSVDFDNTQNVYIEGDNLEALKILQESYLGKIKCIYIDPPYNTGNDFVYNDNFYKKSQEELKDSGIIDENGNVLVTELINTDTNGKFHSSWLTMMYPRLKIARNLLSNKGLIFISIDENEYENLKKICNEIFGANNFIASLKWKKKKQPSFLARVAVVMEYVLIYAKDSNCVEKLSIENLSDSDKPIVNSSNKVTTLHFPSGLRCKADTDLIKAGIYQNKSMSVEFLNDIKIENGRTISDFDASSKFRTTQEMINKFANEDLIFITKNLGFRRDLAEEEKETGKAITDLLLDWGQNQDGSNELKKIFEITNDELLFDNPKPVLLIKNLIKTICNDNDIVLDFFGGSSTTAQSVIEYNIENEMNNKFIIIQLPEICLDGSVAKKMGYANICDIGEDRIKRIFKIFDKNYGFRVYKIDSSNMKDVYYKPNEINQSQMDIFTSNIKEDRTPEDILTQIILDWGLTLDLPIEEKQVKENTVFYVAGNSLVACLDERINIDIIDEIAKCEPVRVVFRDEAFTKDSDKINAYERLKKLSPKTEIKVI